MSIEIQSYFAEGERYPALIGVRAQGDEYETAYVSKSELVDALDENAKLLEQGARLFDKTLELGTENAKLRELARKLAWCAVVPDCGKCDGACEDGDEWPEGSAICTAVDRMMRELGVIE